MPNSVLHAPFTLPLLPLRWDRPRSASMWEPIRHFPSWAAWEDSLCRLAWLHNRLRTIHKFTRQRTLRTRVVTPLVRYRSSPFLVHRSRLGIASPTALGLWFLLNLEAFVILSTCLELGFVGNRTPVMSAGASLGQAFVAVVAREGTKGRHG
jgi:hypothetical protein